MQDTERAKILNAQFTSFFLWTTIDGYRLHRACAQLKKNGDRYCDRQKLRSQAAKVIKSPQDCGAGWHQPEGIKRTGRCPCSSTHYFVPGFTGHKPLSPATGRRHLFAREKFVAANYRPVGLTCVTSKIMEHISTGQLMRHAEKSCIFHSNQHGFHRHHGCEK